MGLGGDLREPLYDIVYNDRGRGKPEFMKDLHPGSGLGRRAFENGDLKSGYDQDQGARAGAAT
jgi:hypothetical protein